MESRPFLLAIPTRNRSQTLLKSLDALRDADRYENLRVVVSDNSDDVDPIARDYCERHGLAYVRPPKVLAMSAHWDWIMRQFAFETFAIATDRSYFDLPRLIELEKLVRATGKVVSYNGALYTEKRPFGLPLWMISSRRMTGSNFEIPCSALIERLTSRFFEPALPRLMTCIIHADHLDRVRRWFPNTLSSLSPDFEFGFKFLHAFEEDTLIFADRAVFMGHSQAESTSRIRGPGQSQAAADFIRLTNLTRLDHSPTPELITPFSGVAHELNKVANELGQQPIIDAANLRGQEKRWLPQDRQGLEQRLHNIRAIFGAFDDLSVQVGLGSLFPDLRRSFSNLPYDEQAETLFSHPGIRRVDEQVLRTASPADPSDSSRLHVVDG